MFNNDHLGGYGMSEQETAQKSEGEWGGLKGVREMGKYQAWWMENIAPSYLSYDPNVTPIPSDEAAAMYDKEMAEKEKLENNNPSPNTPQP